MGKVMDILETIGHFGKNPDGSYTRRLYSTEFFQALEAAEELLRQAGLTTSRDAAGNLRAVLPGTDPEAKHILLGSHLDTVPSGGLYDGAYGVAAAIGCVRRLREEGRKLRHTVEVYAFNGEEASPLGGTFGSRTLAGLTDPDQPLLRETLEGFGHSVEVILACRRDFSDAACYLETHIEQGGRLEKEGIQLGIVSGISNIVRYLVTAEGQSNHGGTTPMEDRQDAMVA
ncbi:M20/M25/M40 family metallo-hydrolase, partial [Acidaminococcus fermentans]|uniref:M20/M25/M40 family metallo-hydrolase n=1 Tax=Acidaminococcus fermentans TaxID=905 RepID=UPI0039F4D5F7